MFGSQCTILPLSSPVLAGDRSQVVDVVSYAHLRISEQLWKLFEVFSSKLRLLRFDLTGICVLFLEHRQHPMMCRPFPKLGIPGGETLQAVFARTACALHETFWYHSNDSVVLVGDDTINRVILLHALDLPLSRYWHLTRNPCVLSELDFLNGAFTIRAVNETWHLNEL